MTGIAQFPLLTKHIPLLFQRSVAVMTDSQVYSQVFVPFPPHVSNGPCDLA